MYVIWQKSLHLRFLFLGWVKNMLNWESALIYFDHYLHSALWVAHYFCNIKLTFNWLIMPRCLYESSVQSWEDINFSYWSDSVLVEKNLDLSYSSTSVCAWFFQTGRKINLTTSLITRWPQRRATRTLMNGLKVWLTILINGVLRSGEEEEGVYFSIDCEWSVCTLANFENWSNQSSGQNLISRQ